MRIQEIKKTDLDSIDMIPYSKFINSEIQKNYFLDKSGNEHYRLLAYLSLKNFSDKIVDIGTFKGLSALSFSMNEKNQIYSFNIVDELDLNTFPNNISFFIDDVTKENFRENILTSKIIFLDTFHDGSFERNFMNYLDEIGYKGCLILDDIRYFGGLINLWEEINKEKYDITEIGHKTGTGLVYYN